MRQTKSKLLDAEILLVEDDDFEAKAVNRAFKQARVANKITRARDGLEALDLLKNELSCRVLGHMPILLVDLNMPRMNGIEFLTQLRSEPSLKRQVAFILTTSDDDTDICDAYDLNVAGYILKSDAGKDFKNLVALLNDFWTTVKLPGSKYNFEDNQLK